MINKILGTWKTDPNDISTIKAFGSISMTFKEDGELIYSVHEEDKDQIALMTYEINDEFLITDQPSHPNKEVTKFAIVDDKLELEYDGVASRFIKVD